MPEWAEYVGALVRWSLNGFKTKFKDELDGILEPITKLSYSTENLILGYLTIIIVGGFIIFITC
jgi:hypothetical protein